MKNKYDNELNIRKTKSEEFLLRFDKKTK